MTDEIAALRVQLAEKDREIAELKKRLERFSPESLKKLLAETQERVEKQSAERAAKREKAAAARRSPCVDCGRDTGHSRGGLCEEYMVRDAIWAGAGMNPDGFLCVGCLESRIGRQLIRPDFTVAPINDPSYGRQSERLYDRLRRAAIERRVAQ
jgi:hypothetical protein